MVGIGFRAPVSCTHNKEPEGIRLVGNIKASIWVVVNIRVPFWVLIIIQHLMFKVPKRGPTHMMYTKP